MSGRKKGSKVERDTAVTPGLDELIARKAQEDHRFRAADEDSEFQFSLLKYLAGVRRERKLSQIEVAKQMDTGQSAVSELEQGIVEPRLSTLQRYARVLGYRLWVVPIKAQNTPAYLDRHFNYPAQPRVPVRARKGSVPHLSLAADLDESNCDDNVRYVEFRRRDQSALGDSIADRLNGPVAA